MRTIHPNPPSNNLDPETTKAFFQRLYQPAPVTEHPWADNWLNEVKNASTPTQPYQRDLVEAKINVALKYTAPWKTPGPDMVPTALYKYLPSAKRYLTSFICRAVEGDYKLTKEDVEGNLVLIHKKGDATDPANYRPIALLNVDYKLLTKTVLELLRDAIPPTLIPKQQLARRCEWHPTRSSDR